MYMSHNILVPQKTVPLGPFAVLRFRGQLFNAAKSAVRALDVLELLSTADRPLRAVQIARALGLSPSSANQLLKTLVDAAYLIFDPDSKLYLPSPRVRKLSHAKNSRSGCAIDDLMESAHRVLGKFMILSTSQGSCMQVLDVVEPHPHSSEKLPIPVDTWIGMRIPLFGSCHGAAWLSTQSDQTICATAQRCRRELGPKAKNLDQIFERIRRVRAQGYAFGGLTEHDHERMLAMALPQLRNGIVLVLGTYGPASEMENRREEIARVLREHIARYFLVTTTS
jgi:DNA-binding IclR family transcriptional regulator